jgi:molybdopterin converting factor small subunit
LFKCVIGLFGIPHDVTDKRQVEIELPDDAGLTDLIAALRHKIPKLEGAVIHPGEDKLTDYFAFNINGRFYNDDKDIRIRSGDRVGLLALATGG